MATPALEFSDVTLIFDNVVALDRVSFRVHPGDSLVILGAAASGKSVLLKLALGLLQPDAGEIYLFGEQISRMSEADLLPYRQQVGMVFQESALFDSLTVFDNVAYPLVNRDGGSAAEPDDVAPRVLEALRFVELEHAVDKLPSELSGGMRRRVAIARAIVGEPRLVLYDSPTAGLDPITAHTIVTLILKERDTAGVTSLIVTHRLQNAHLVTNFRYDSDSGDLVPAAAAPASRTELLVLRQGRVAFRGSQQELALEQDAYVRKFVMKR